jgi:hypothetical protein
MNSHITIGTRVRELTTGRIGVVMEYLAPVVDGDATHRVTFDDVGVMPSGHPVYTSAWFPESALVEADTRDDEPVTDEQTAWLVWGGYFKNTTADDRENIVGAARGGVRLLHPKANLRMATLARMGLVVRDTRSPAWLATPLGIAFAAWLESVRVGEGVMA